MEENYNQIFVQKTKALAVRLINELSEIPYSDKVSVIRKQIFRSSTSVASNYRAMCRARSKKERYAKICIVVEEADETLFWLEIIEEIKMLPKEILADLTAKCLDVLKATSSYKKKLNLGS
ncbi:four helix bundle protein [Elizabethkingia anophelis]|uniref:Four helix bundle protein n=1 Tax=Elizabethkingia anophelis TaxID=1117645 RepID=A0AAE4P182_9FLAO|nr:MULTISPECIES: four helix bundle protein [Elizabethkingia]KUF38063.1 four helix bundle protein [Elizabethkingia anophelis]MCT3643249.1 four helix bundle protein [Elizabethkingia anophelis]MCT3649379.1 four helix bundle protein [Elizabethkingia anophelis]MCT3652696.1 four helix bundle protein [Elizabethkingia anophelis]MCT3654623.1 four helix bundle protein [Elizabethkingia anophelis]